MSDIQNRRRSSTSRNRRNSSTHQRGSGPKSRQQQRKKKRIILFGVEIAVIIALIIGLFAWTKLSKVNYDDIGDVDVNEDMDDEVLGSMSNYVTIALFGVDNRSNGNLESGNSDSIMICNISKDTYEVQLVSVYRDTALDVDGNSTFRKCNYAYNHGGASESVAMLNRNLDLNIQEYVAVDFNALVDAIDALNGIDLDITSEEISDSAGKLNAYIDEVASITGKKANHITSAGTHHCDGVQATAYCRLRYTAGDDFKRTERQRTVLTKMAEKVKTMTPSEANKLVDSILPQVATSLSTSEIMDLAADVSKYQLTDTCGFPFTYATGTYGSKGSLVVPCTLASNVTTLHNYLFDDDDYTPSGTVTSLSNSIVSFSGCSESSATNAQ